MLPLGLRVMDKIINIVREEMNAIDGQEVTLTALQDKAVWEKTDRWSDEVVDNWFKTELKSGSEVGLGFTHEEPLTAIMTEYVNSYRDLPRYVYQFQTKFRNELRSKSGVMRGREFLMKDLYSFSKNLEEHNEYYERAKQAYFNIFRRVGLGDITYLTLASGGSFSKYSHEFQTLTEAGEDTIFLHEKSGIAVNKEVCIPEVLDELGVKKEDLVERRAAEVGNIFSLGTRFSEPLGLTYLDLNGEKQIVVMGSYGIGIGRIMGTVVEALSDKKGIVWPEAISPFDIHLIEIPSKNTAVKEKAERLYRALEKSGKSVLYDDREGVRAGEKFADAELIGVPKHIIVSERGIEDETVEIKERITGESRVVKEGEVM